MLARKNFSLKYSNDCCLLFSEKRSTEISIKVFLHSNMKLAEVSVGMVKIESN